MSFQSFNLHLSWRIFAILLFTSIFQSSGLNIDGVLLLSLKYSVLSDPLGKLTNWSYQDETPCSWNGVTCGNLNASDEFQRVISLSLPNSQLLGPIPENLGMIQHLKSLDLSNNSINGSIPLSIYLASRLQNLDFSNNLISGEVSELVGGLKSLQVLNLSDNAISGKIPGNLTTLYNLSVISLKSNYFFGDIPGGFDYVHVLDLSSNLINGSLPSNFGGSNLSYFNVSFNRLSGEIPLEFSNKIPFNATLDLSFNNLTGEIPDASVFFNQDSKSFSGNQGLCGRPLKNLCSIPSTMSISPNASEPNSPPAIAAIPKTIDSTPADSSDAASMSSEKRSTGRKPVIIAAIVVANVAFLTFLLLVFVCIYHYKRKKNTEGNIKKEAKSAKEFDWASSNNSGSSEESYNWLKTWTCLKKPRYDDGEETSSESTNTESTEDNVDDMRKSRVHQLQQQEQKNGELVTIDGEIELELETLLKASAYILGASGSSIMYKAVLEDGTTLAVRRIGESGVERFKDFENQVRVIAKLVHPNLVKIRGFYWGVDEKLVVYDFVPNGSLANARYRKAGTSPCHLPWEMRLKIAIGVARGLTYIHDKKHVHGNLKPSNILLGVDMEPKIGDFGLERLVTGENSSKASGGSARNFGSKRSTTSRDSFHDIGLGATPSPSPSSFAISPYYAPESLRSLKPNPKWDVFSFGVVLLELLTGRVIVSDETGPGLVIGDVEEKGKVTRMADVSIRADIEGKEDAFMALMKLGYNCISYVPQRRPSMKEILQALEKFPSSSSSSYYFGH